jgi:DNA-binding NarL/FixJ family response regulator
VGVVDDDEDARAACELMLARAGRPVVAYASAHDAVRAARAGELPGIVLMDMHLPGESAGRAIAAIREAVAETLVIALTSHASDDFVFEALRAGAVGYLLKKHAVGELAEAIEVVERGGSPLSPGVARRVIATFQAEGERFEPLSGREQDILSSFATGASYKQTAEQLGISVDTVRTHVRRMYCKLQVSSRAEALVAAVRRGLLGRRDG